LSLRRSRELIAHQLFSFPLAATTELTRVIAEELTLRGHHQRQEFHFQKNHPSQ
jgi:hypothetical protein